ncbi:hypothetical protein KGO95_01885 [Patescibacteria group bacterium]|nr:hypothetical protein [Patescibacteria group bacterium]
MKKEELLQLIDATSDTDDAGFQKIIREAMDDGIVSLRGLANYFQVSLPTVRRWRGDMTEGSNVPHPAMRKHVFAHLKEVILSVPQERQPLRELLAKPAPDPGSSPAYPHTGPVKEELSFSVTDLELKRIRAFRKKHRCDLPNDRRMKRRKVKKTGPIGRRFTYSFTPTTIGTAVKIGCACGKEEDVTDYDSW